MWAIAGILLTGGFIVYVEAPKLVRKKMVKELFIFLALLAFGVILSVLEALKVRLPNPLAFITSLHKPFSDFLFALLK